MTETRPPAEYQGAAALAGLLRILPDDMEWPAGVARVTYRDWVANTVVFTVNGVVFHAVVVVPS